MDAGWYIDPRDPATGRYHDGSDWTDDTVAIPPGKTLPRPPEPVAPAEPDTPLAQAEPPAQDKPVAPGEPDEPATASVGRDRSIMVLLGTLVVVVVAGTAILLLTRNHTTNSPQVPTSVEAANQTRSPSSACGLAFTQQLSSETVSTDPPGSLLTCTRAEWIGGYEKAAAALGQHTVNGAAALQGACLPYQSSDTRPNACSG